MNIIEAHRLSDRFGGFFSHIGKNKWMDRYIYLNKYLIWCDKNGVEDTDIESNVFPDSKVFADNKWLYYNDKFECLTCEKCYKLLNEMEGLAPVCECKVGLRITNAPPSGIQTQDAFDPASYKDALLYEFIKDCQIDGVLYRTGERVRWEKSKVKFIEDGGIIEIASNNPYWPPRVSAQYPGMIEVNYLDGEKRVLHYARIVLFERYGNFYASSLIASIEAAIDNTIAPDTQLSPRTDVRISEQEYHRILNLFKASGLEVNE